ncbi:cholinesterase, partial [Biomphalaria glabrata]
VSAKVFTLLSICWVSLFLFTTAAPVSTTIVETPLGSVQGLIEIAVNNQSYLSFRGIPYAKPPVGKLRFAKPEPLPVSKSGSVIDATRFGASCIQSVGELAPGETISEDCLFLNVYVKDLSRKQRKVLVWIHGGAFVFGSPYIYTPGSIVTNEDIIVVSINYRLGVLGFLSTEDISGPGNYGLWDQISAITWVKNNIEAFGGDANDITIAGESAGGASASILSISPATKDLFTKVYSHSGFATSLFNNYKNAKSDAIALAKKLDCYQISSSSEAIIDCLRNKPVSSLVPDVDPMRITFVPRVDEELLPRSPMKLLEDEAYLLGVGFYKRDYLIALNNNEASAVHKRYYPARDEFYLLFNGTTEQKDAIWKQLIVGTNVGDRFEVQTPNPSAVNVVSSWYENRYDGQNGYPILLTDVNFVIPAFDILDAASEGPATRVWFTYFNHYPKYLTGPEKGMLHGLDIAYSFDVPLATMNAFIQAGAVDDFTETDEKIKKIFTSFIGDFVRGQVNSTRWPHYKPEVGLYLELNDQPVVKKQLAQETRHFWKTELPKSV